MSREVQTGQRLFSSKVRSECWRTVMSSVQGPVRRVLSCHPKSFLSVVEGPVRLSPKVLSVAKGAIQCWRTCPLFQVLSDVMSCRARSFLSVVEGPVLSVLPALRGPAGRCSQRPCPMLNGRSCWPLRVLFAVQGYARCSGARLAPLLIDALMIV